MCSRLVVGDRYDAYHTNQEPRRHFSWGNYLKLEWNILWQGQVLALALTTSIVSKHDTFRRDCQKQGAEAIYLRSAFWRAGRDTFFGKGLRATRVPTLSPDLGISILAALISGRKNSQDLRLETALKAPLSGKGR